FPRFSGNVYRPCTMLYFPLKHALIPESTMSILRQREIVHDQRFGEALRITLNHLNEKNFYAFNPSFDTPAANR
ncbi:MAG: hypothetical protein ABF449_13865, partial [Ethanoligenens sp.]